MALTVWRATVVVLLAWIAIELHGLAPLADASLRAGDRATGASAAVPCSDRPPGGSPWVTVKDRLEPPSSSPLPAPAAPLSARLAVSPQRNAGTGSVGLGAQHLATTRMSGAPQYGNALFEYLVRAPIGDSQFDVGASFWSTATDMTAGTAALFGAWIGANTPGTAQTFGGGATIGLEVNAGNRFGDFGLQKDVGGKRYTVGIQIVPDVVPTVDTLSHAVTMAEGTPGIVSWKAHGLAAGTPLQFIADARGQLPAGLSSTKTYYVAAGDRGDDGFAVASRPGADPIPFVSPSSGSIRAIPSYPGSFAQMIGPSVHAHRWWVGTLLRPDTIMPGGYGMYQAGGANPGVNVPLAWSALAGHWANGLDFSAARFGNAALKFGAAQVSRTASAGDAGTPPGAVDGYLIVDINGALKRIPFYAP